MTDQRTGQRADGVLHPGFLSWLGATTVSATGDGILYFALAWTASGIGPEAATAVMVAGLVPEVVLTLLGGAAADRWGVRRTLIGCTVAMSALIVAFLGARAAGTPLFALLVGVAVAQGIVGSFQMPATNVVPRLFFPDALISRAMALTGTVSSVARLVGPPLGAVVVAAFSISGVLVVDLVSFLVVLVVICAVRPPLERRFTPGATSTWHDVRSGLVAVGAGPGILAMLGSLALVAGGLLPLLSLGVPLLVRERGWHAADAGVIEACWIAGTLAVSVLVARTGTSARPLRALVGGPLLAATAVVMLCLAPSPLHADGAAVLMGLGTAVFTTHFFPLYVLRSPADMVGRFQSVLIQVQMVAMLLGNLALGGAVSRWGVQPTLVAAALVCALAAIPIALSTALRSAAGPALSRQ